MDVNGRLRQLEELIADAKSMPLSSSAMVNREEVLGLVEEVRQALPEEIRQARWVVRDREDLLAKARRDAEQLIDEAKAEQSHLLSEQEVVRRSYEEAERIVMEANEHARQIRNEAEDYVDAKLAAFEVALTRTYEELTKTIEQVERGRERLRGASVAEESFAKEEEL